MLLDPNIVNEEEIIIKAEEIMAKAPDSVSGRSQAIDKIIELVTELPDQGTRELFIDEIAEKFRSKKRSCKPSSRMP
jgi:DNA-binding ferritin-like protein